MKVTETIEEKEFQGISIPKVPISAIKYIEGTSIAKTKFALMAIEEKIERDSKK